MIEFTEHPANGQTVISVTCDGDPSCMDSQFFPLVRGEAHDGLLRISTVMGRYGWETVEKRRSSPALLATPLIESYCPVHATNPPPRGYQEPVLRMGRAYGPGTEDYTPDSDYTAIRPYRVRPDFPV